MSSCISTMAVPPALGRLANALAEEAAGRRQLEGDYRLPALLAFPIPTCRDR